MKEANIIGKLEETLKNCNIHRNLSVSKLVEEAVKRGEAQLSNTGALCAKTGKYTGRSPKDKYIVKEKTTEMKIDWGAVNQPMSEEKFQQLYQKALHHMEGKELFVFEGTAGADEEHAIPIRVVNEYAWHNLFVRQLFIRFASPGMKANTEGYTVICLPSMKADTKEDGTKSETFIVLSLEKRIILIGGTEYAGEMKKSIFSVMNYILPLKNVLPMHCSANVGEKGDVALFFGLSGTGKTTLSADPKRKLIGDDEHGWSEQGVFNFEGGCYAKCVNLSEEKEPQIWNAIKFGSVLENLILDETTRKADYDDISLTENTRAAYPLDYIENAIMPSKAGHPNVVVFLTADAFGVLPPVSKLTKEQAMYHFLSGYTSKLAGTERGVTSPEATFSTCFGAPFLPLAPSEYAKLLGEKIEKHNTKVYLLNTGWSGGSYGEGERIKLSYTRAMVDAIMNGSIEESEVETDPVFGLHMPKGIEGVPSDILNPKNAWKNKEEYDKKAMELADLFASNMKKFKGIFTITIGEEE